MVKEVRVSVDDSGKAEFESSGAGPRVSENTHELLQEDPAHVTYIFEAPLDLQRFAGSSTGGTTPTVTGDALRRVHRMRLHILEPISTCELTPLEENGGIDGPNVSPLVQAWREATHAIPQDHPIREIQFDMTCGQQIELREIVRLLQHISTVMNMKTQGPVRCSVLGCPDDRKIWLERSLVGAGPLP